MRSCLLLLVCLWSANSAPAYSQLPITAAADLPAFFYAGDQPKLQFVLQNSSTQEITGNLQLELFDAVNKQPVDGWFFNQLANQYFTIAPGERSVVRFPLTIPSLYTGKVDWQLTVRVDSAQQQISGHVDIKEASRADGEEQENHVTVKGGVRLLRSNGQPSKSEAEPPITPFSTEPIGQPVVLRLTISLTEKMDSCRVLLPLSAGLQPSGGRVQLKKGKAGLLVQKSLSDTAISLTLYQLVPGLYEWDYKFTTRYPGEFWVPGCRLLLFNLARRTYRTNSTTLSID